MSVGVLLVSQGGIASKILENAVTTLAGCPLTVQAVEVDTADDTNWTEYLAHKIKQLNSGGGVIVLVDLCGSSACNRALEAAKGLHAAVVAGLNLPMLIKVLNYPDRSLEEVQDLAVRGARDGVRVMD